MFGEKIFIESVKGLLTSDGKDGSARILVSITPGPDKSQLQGFPVFQIAVLSQKSEIPEDINVEEKPLGSYISMLLPEERRTFVMDFDTIVEHNKSKYRHKSDGMENVIWVYLFPCQGWQKYFSPLCIPVRIYKDQLSDVIFCI